MKRFSLLLIISFAALLPARAVQDELYFEDFDAFNTGNLYPHTGFVQVTAGGTTNPIKVVVDPDDSDNRFVRLGGPPTAPTYTGQDLLGAFDSSAAYVIGGSLEVDFNLVIRVAQTGDYFFAFAPSSSAAEASFFGKLFAKTDGAGGFNLGLSAVDDVATYGANSLDYDVFYGISIVWEFLGGKGKDTFTLLIDGDEELTEVWTENGATPNALASFFLRQGSSTGAPVAILDDVDILYETPEPGSLALISLAAGALMFVRRRAASFA